MLNFNLSQRPVHTASVTQVRELLHQQAVGQWQKVESHLQAFTKAYNKHD